MLSHFKYFRKEKDIIADNGKVISIYKLEIGDDQKILNEWAKHLREHYCLDKDIDFLSSGYGKTTEEYLRDIKFPDPSARLGPSVMSGDFAEILVHDYIEFVEKYNTIRTRYINKDNRNSSTMGSDILGYKLKNDDPSSPSLKDELIVLEAKAQASETNPKKDIRDAPLQKAVNGSSKDIIKVAEELNAEVQRLYNMQRFQEASIFQRFQNKTDRPYKLSFSAVAIHSTKSHSEELIKQIDTSNHLNSDLNLLVFYSDELMQFIKKMYTRASRC